MGTSQSFNLKSSPNWAKAKRRMSTFLNSEGNQQKLEALMSAFVLALNDNIVEAPHNAPHNTAGGNHGLHSHVVFGKAAGQARIYSHSLAM